MRLRLAPRTDEFFDLFRSAGENAHETARAVEQRFRGHPDAGLPQARVKALENEGDAHVRHILTLVNTQYVTPLEREDIYALAHAVDDVVDHAEYASDLLDLYRIQEVRQPALEQCRVLVEATANVATALGTLRHLAGAERCVLAAKRLEDEGDAIVRAAIAELFDDDELPTRTLIRWKDIYQALEDALDACDRVANLIGGVAIKNA